jgi:hypothetical protein
MKSYLVLHVGLVFLMALVATACSSASPKMSVLGVKSPRIQRFAAPSVKVFVEVYNPTRSELSLDRLRYRLQAEDWFDSQGEVQVERVIGAGASAIVEILVPIETGSREQRKGDVPYILDASLYATTDQALRSWELRSKGSLLNSRHIRLADRETGRSN